MEFNEFLINVAKESYKSRLRYGQIFWNLLLEEKPELALRIRGTENDPFYLDVDKEGAEMDRICRFLQDRW